jgi:RimJ/RimL family protein N-acetyltransferase
VGYVCHVLDQYVDLKLLTDADEQQIHQWPPYTGKLAPLDYGLRDQGWLKHFPAAGTARGQNKRYGAWRGENLVGFAILGDIKSDEAEFYVALHPDRIGQHIGPEITERIVTTAFQRLGLKRVYLKVREHHPARAMYAELGFREVGQPFTEDINGQPVIFVRMECTPREPWFRSQLKKAKALRTAKAAAQSTGGSLLSSARCATFCPPPGGRRAYSSLSEVSCGDPPHG